MRSISYCRGDFSLEPASEQLSRAAARCRPQNQKDMTLSTYISLLTHRSTRMSCSWWCSTYDMMHSCTISLLHSMHRHKSWYSYWYISDIIWYWLILIKRFTDIYLHVSAWYLISIIKSINNSIHNQCLNSSILNLTISHSQISMYYSMTQCVPEEPIRSGMGPNPNS